MAMSAAKETTESYLPQSATITIRKQEPQPRGELEVTPNAGRIIFDNKDDKEYRLRLWKTETDSAAGLDVLLPANGAFTVLIKQNDVFSYSVMNLGDVEALSGNGGGPIRN
jgi:hypothetical protein